MPFSLLTTKHGCSDALFFLPNVDSNTWAFGFCLYCIPTQYQCIQHLCHPSKLKPCLLHMFPFHWLAYSDLILPIMPWSGWILFPDRLNHRLFHYLLVFEIHLHPTCNNCSMKLTAVKAVGYLLGPKDLF